jgi:hypothetical protein
VYFGKRKRKNLELGSSDRINQESYTREKEAYSNLCVTVHLDILATTIYPQHHLMPQLCVHGMDISKNYIYSARRKWVSFQDVIV